MICSDGGDQALKVIDVLENICSDSRIVLLAAENILELQSYVLQ
jgi:hypothetical protein